MAVSADPAREILPFEGFHIGVVTGSQDGDKNMGRVDDTGGGILNGDGVTGKVGEELFSQVVNLTERTVEGFSFFMEPVTELSNIDSRRDWFPCILPKEDSKLLLF